MLKFLITSIAYLFILSCAAQTQQKSLLWEISGNGLIKKSYLYGTMHVQDNRVFQFNNKVLFALDSADFYLMELHLDSVNPIELFGSLLMPKNTSLESLLKKKEYALVENYFKDSLQMNLIMFNKIQPFYTATIIGTKEFKQEQPLPLDAYFFERAKNNNITCIGLEKLTEQVAVFASIPFDFQANYLLETVKNLLSGNSYNETEELINLYLEGNLEGLLNLTLSNFSEKKIKSIFEEMFITSRNQNMATRLIPYISTGSAFIAVGAAHLGGQNGIISLLQKQGYTVVAI